MFILLFLLYSVLANGGSIDFDTIRNYFSSSSNVTETVDKTVETAEVNTEEVISYFGYENDGGESKSDDFQINKDAPKQGNFMFREVKSCPASGYFFHREADAGRPGPCYLCFCQSNKTNTSICWPRDNKKCSDDSYYYHVGKRDARHKRSPAGLSDIFFRDATRQLFNRDPPSNCKPFESSFSEGCPPADWCLGCTVCDCDAEGHWDCHTLSFCPDDTNTKKPKTEHKGPYKRKVYKPNSKKQANQNNSKQKGANKSTRGNKNVNQKQKTMPKIIKASTRVPSKVSNITPVKKQSKNIHINPVRRNPVVVKNQPAKRSPQIRALNKRSPIVKSKPEKRTKEIKKNVPVGKSHQVKGSMKKPLPTKFPAGKKVPKKATPVKNAPVRKNMHSRNSLNFSPNKTPAKRSTTKSISTAPNKSSAIPRKVKLTSRPVVKSKVTKPSPKNPSPPTATTTHLPTMDTLTKEKVNQEIMKSFMTAFTKILDKHYSRPKRAVTKSMRAESDEAAKDEGLGFTEPLMNRHKRSESLVTTEVIPTQAMNSTTSYYVSSTTATITAENSTNFTPTTTTRNVSKGYFKYTLDTSSVTAIAKDQIQTNESTADPKTTTGKRSIHINTNANKTNKAILSNRNIKTGTSETYTNTPSILIQEILKPQTPSVLVVDDSYLANDLKFNKWSEVQAFKDKEQNLKAKEKNSTSDKSMMRNSTILPSRAKIHTSDIARKVGGKKHLIKKVTVPNNRTRTYSTPPTHTLANSSTTINSFAKNILSHIAPHNSTKKRKVSKNKVIRYLQKIFRRIFSRSTKSKKVDINNSFTNSPKILNQESVLDTLCDTFGPCHISHKNRAKLEPRIQDLSKETNNMLKSIGAIKGLLKLVDFPDDDGDLKNKNRSSKTKPNFETDVQKLTAILKGTYAEKKQLDKLSETQLNQLEYIKKNTDLFVKSTSNFAKVLFEIVDIISKDQSNAKNKSSKRNSRLMKRQKDKNHTKKPETYDRMKTLLLKFNLLQNRFVERMYDVLTKLKVYTTPSSFQKNLTKSTKLEPSLTTGMVTEKPLQLKSSGNSTAAIQTYTKNIIKNLRKLKSLAQSLTSGRRKRDLRDDESMEYLLVLMEYLLKQNYQFDNTPARDGIDILIDAIKQAPDIKSIKTKYAVPKAIVKFHPPLNNSLRDLDLKSNEDSGSDINKISKEERITSMDTRYNGIEDSMDDSGMEFRISSNRKAIIEIKITTNPPLDDLYKSTTGTAVTEIETTSVPSSTVKYNKYKVINNVDSGGNISDDTKIELANGDSENIEGTYGEINNNKKDNVENKENTNIGIAYPVNLQSDNMYMQNGILTRPVVEHLHFGKPNNDIDNYGYNNKKHKAPKQNNLDNYDITIFKEDDNANIRNENLILNENSLKRPENDNKTTNIEEVDGIGIIFKPGESDEIEDRKPEGQTRVIFLNNGIDDDATILGNADDTKPETTTHTIEETTRVKILFDDDNIKPFVKSLSSARKTEKYLDWLDESFEEEIKAEANLTFTTRKPTQDKLNYQESGMTKESNEGKKIQSDEVVYQKEMNLLNSLDYGNVKSDSDATDSKEQPEDKYNNDPVF